MIPGAPLVVLIPLMSGAAIFVLRRWIRAEAVVAALLCLLISALIIFVPTTPLPIVPGAYVAISLDAPLEVLGRTLRVQPEDRALLGLLFIAAALLFLLSWRVPQGSLFVPLGLMALAALVAALLVSPFLYAALAFEAAAAFAVLMIQAERGGERSTLGALRYLIAVTLAMPLLLLAGWVIDSASVPSPVDAASAESTYGAAAILLLISFGLLLGAIPIFTWIHPVVHDAPPLVAAFLTAVGIGAASFLLMKLLQAYLWLRLIPLFSQSLIAGGLVMIAFGGVLAWAQGSFSRLLACAVFVEVGCLLLNLGSASQAGAEAVAFSLPARALALGTFGLGVWRLRAARNSDDFVAVRGLRDVWGGFALGIGGLSLAGSPGTLGFVSRWLTIQAYGLSDPESLALLSFAQISIGVGLVRGLSAMFQQSDPELVGDLSRSETLDLRWANRIPVYPARTPATAPTVIGIVGIVNPLSDVLSRLRQQFDERLPVAAGAVALVVLGLWPEPLAWLAKAAAQHFLFSP